MGKRSESDSENESVHKKIKIVENNTEESSTTIDLTNDDEEKSDSNDKEINIINEEKIEKKTDKEKENVNSDIEEEINKKRLSMMTEKEKMLSGELYDFNDPQLSLERLECRKIVKKINDSEPEEVEKRINYFKQLFKKFGEKSFIEPPFHCDYGSNISIGDRTMFNFDNIILDCTYVTIGDDCLFSPGCKIISVTHPLDYNLRKNIGKEYTKPVKIGNGCFFGAGSIILPGVTIGDRVIVGAGSVVSTDIESDTVVGGNPAVVLRKIERKV